MSTSQPISLWERHASARCSISKPIYPLHVCGKEERERKSKETGNQKKKRERIFREGKKKEKEKKVGALFHGCGGGPHA